MEYLPIRHIANPDARRIVVSYIKINKETIDGMTDKFPISGVSANHEFLQGKLFYGEVDIEECFHQFRLREDC